jgi:hypothetical protein
MPVVKIFTRLELNETISFLDGHYIVAPRIKGSSAPENQFNVMA